MRRRPTLIVLPALAAAALAAGLAWWLSPWRGAGPSPPPEQGRAARSAAPMPAGAPANGNPSAPLAAPGDQGKPAPAPGLGSSPGAATTTTGNDPPAADPAQVNEDLYLAPTGSDAVWDHNTFRDATGVPDAVDAETAYTAFEFLASCIRMPRTEREFEQRLERIERTLERQPRRIPEDFIEQQFDHAQWGYLRCYGLRDMDLVAAALDWLQLAADRGHLRAQIEFYELLPNLMKLGGDRVFREPAYLDLHRTKSQDYFARALKTGHPQAFLAFAKAIMDDVLYEPDPIAAYAHLHAGDLAAGGALPEITQELTRLQARLSGRDLRAARTWGRELCRQWCRGLEGRP